MIRPGDIGFAGKRQGFYPKAVRWFTSSRWSHCLVITPPVLGHLSVIEADLMVVMRTWEKEYVERNNDYYEIWRPIGPNESEIFRACAELYRSDAGEIYGFLQIAWFAFRQGLGKLGIRVGGRNWFPSGEICSETLWAYLARLPGEAGRLAREMGEDECSPEDLYRMVRSRPDLFELVARRD